MVSSNALCRRAILWSVVFCTAFAAAENPPQQNLDRQFQSAVAHYNAGQFPEAASQLETLLPHVPHNFEAQELLGLVYAAMSDDAKAIVHLEAAVRLKPDSAPARTNLASSLSRSGSTQLAGEQLRKALALAPHDYTTNHNLGEFYIKSGKIPEGRSLLERAQQIEPSSYDNGPHDASFGTRSGDAQSIAGQLRCARVAAS